jgi:hypothetical protein
LARFTVNVFVVPAAKPPQPDAATNDKFTAVVEAVPPESGVAVNHEGSAKVLFSIVNGVPLGVSDLTASVCAGPGVYTGPTGFRVHVNVIAAGVVISGDVEPTVTATVAVTMRSTPALVLKRKVTVLEPLLKPAQPAAALTV